MRRGEDQLTTRQLVLYEVPLCLNLLCCSAMLPNAWPFCQNGQTYPDCGTPGSIRGDMTLRDCETRLALSIPRRRLRRGQKRYGLGWRPYILVADNAAPQAARPSPSGLRPLVRNFRRASRFASPLRSGRVPDSRKHMLVHIFYSSKYSRGSDESQQKRTLLLTFEP